ATNWAATVTGTTTVSDANAIDAVNGTGFITATIAEGDVATLKTLTGTGNAYTITVTDTTSFAADLTAIDTKTTVAVGAAAVTSISGTVDEVKAVVDAAGIATATNYSATISDADADEGKLNAVLGDTTGVVTASLAGVAAALNAALSNGSSGDALSIKLDAGAAAAADLTGLGRRIGQPL
ncbi:MAG: hypothetical protein EBW84_12595, partial [Betaproteobacteria bacterium]|nr:hypothetical protein [Betaproteobacteria bacterium]